MLLLAHQAVRHQIPWAGLKKVVRNVSLLTDFVWVDAGGERR
jgi:hypothetical protein